MYTYVCIRTYICTCTYTCICIKHMFVFRVYSINEESEIDDNENIHTIAKVCMHPCTV